MLVEPYRHELQVHCYRMLGSLQDAEDLVQETLLASWRGLGGFEERASLRAWLYRIATNRCLNAPRERGRRPALEETLIAPPPTRYVEPSWLEPYPDSALPDSREEALVEGNEKGLLCRSFLSWRYWIRTSDFLLVRSQRALMDRYRIMISAVDPRDWSSDPAG